MMLVLIRALPISNLVGFYNLNNWKPAKIDKILMENFQTVTSDFSSTTKDIGTGNTVGYYHLHKCSRRIWYYAKWASIGKLVESNTNNDNRYWCQCRSTELMLQLFITVDSDFCINGNWLARWEIGSISIKENNGSVLQYFFESLGVLTCLRWWRKVHLFQKKAFDGYISITLIVWHDYVRGPHPIIREDMSRSFIRVIKHLLLPWCWYTLRYYLYKIYSHQTL